MSILVVAAHPDDEVLGCGGTIARASRQTEVRTLILGEGITSRYRTRARAPRAALRRLQAQARQAARLLGVEAVTFAGLPDNRFDAVPLLEVVKHVEAAIARWQPTVVYTHHPGDLNVDHQLTARAVLTATRPMRGCPVRELYAFEIASSTEWAFQRIEPVFRPTVFSDIQATLDVKIQALACYRDEMRPFPHPRSAQALRAIAARWGSVAGAPAAEAFELMRWIR